MTIFWNVLDDLVWVSYASSKPMVRFEKVQWFSLGALCGSACSDTRFPGCSLTSALMALGYFVNSSTNHCDLR